MTTTTEPTGTSHRPMGTWMSVAGLILGPALLGLALAIPHDPWADSLPNYEMINNDHGLLLLSLNIAAVAIPFACASVVALAVQARRSRLLSGWGLGCSVLGLLAMFGNAMLDVPVALMYGIDDRAGLDQLALRLSEPPLVALYAFPLFLVGSLLLGAALWRSGATPPWAAACIAVGGLFPIAVLTGISALALPIAALRIAGSVPLIKTLVSRAEG
jgi:hypothetical protein